MRRCLDLTVMLSLLLVSRAACAGGPAYVAGVSYFNSGTAGTPITWAGGTLTYYTDQGDLSPALPHASADSFVASTFALWTSIPTAAVSATQAGELAEDVSGTNVYANSDGSISMPADILPSATGTPVGIVYDEDGSVTDALLGQGASDAAYCLSNAVFGGPDNFTTDAHFAHALVVINGNCAQSSTQLPDVQYRLARVLGRVLGLGWSQANINVDTGKPAATSADYAGFPVMHNLDPSFCDPISNCYPNASQPKMDDQAALSRLYPVTTQNQSAFPGKTIFSTSTASIHGTVYFADANGQPTQPMQGVNVVARWMDPSTGQPSRTYVASCVSGFLFRGNAGNPATGYSDNTGQRFDRFGSADATLEGFFDLAGLQIPNGASSAQYQLTVEGLDPTWSESVGPYAPSQVLPSGAAQPITVTVTLGGDVQQDIAMLGSAIAQPDSFGPTTYAAPAAVPASGEWNGSLTGYGDADYFSFSGQANRTLSVEVTALDETGTVSQSKAEPVIGLWALSDPGTFPAPANSPSAFNTSTLGLTQLNAAFYQSTSFRMGLFDIRGDGRPDYRYRARIFYGDNVNPARASVAGGTLVTVQGLGFHSNVKAAVAGTNAPVLSQTENQLLLSAPAEPDGVQNVALNDPATSASSTMTGVLTYGAGPTDTIELVSGANPTTPVGGQAPNPVIVEAVAADGVTPVGGATVVFSSSPALSFAACNGAATCTVITDSSGRASSYMTPLAAGVNTITAALAPASYNPPQQVQTTLYAEAAALDLSLTPSRVWAAQGATLSIPITAKVLANGTPVVAQTVTFSLSKGTGTLIPASSMTDSNGNAASTLQVTGLSGEVDGSACATSGSTTNCQNFAIFAVAPSAFQVQLISGSPQEIPVGQSFQPVIVRVTDSSSPPNPVSGAAVTFQSVIGRALNNEPVIWIGDLGITQNPMPVLLGSSQASVITDSNGLATLQPSTNSIQGPLLILGTATIGSVSQPFMLQSLP
jgi:IPT/TIG domain